MIKNLSLMVSALVFLSGCSQSTTAPDHTDALPSVSDAVGECLLSDEDAAWIDQAMANWTFTRREILGASELTNIEAVFFSKDCQLNNKTIMTSEPKSPWQVSAHGGTVSRPDGETMPPVVASSAGSVDGGGYFIMSTPSVWREGGVKSDMGLEVLMYAVMLHEGSHVLQVPTYGAMITEQAEKYGLSDDFNDDTMQDLFESNAEYAAAIQAETDMFMQSALAGTQEEARTLALQALDMIEDRRDRWLVEEYAKYRHANDVWITLEGSGQWVGYAWLVHPEGHALDPQTAIDEWGLRSRFWTQNEGFAMTLALDRLSNDWKRPAFKEGGATITEMLRDAAAE